jgi:hypothetical protein
MPPVRLELPDFILDYDIELQPQLVWTLAILFLDPPALGDQYFPHCFRLGVGASSQVCSSFLFDLRTALAKVRQHPNRPFVFAYPFERPSSELYV